MESIRENDLIKVADFSDLGQAQPQIPVLTGWICRPIVANTQHRRLAHRHSGMNQRYGFDSAFQIKSVDNIMVL